ncbi:hypothetical protein FPSE_11022 [Fusarium pseudograminearum CS3096]|uniref:DUF7730 domain-containing protein n=1 Tax=Fusarium pseudograminearum (strain CS3096) TaxID=1028729 RepID=K3VXF4_FUSPC|nr:hypothetical protein FPSE_11022 [Fusarium pseudograminearum CS3096]EKJ68805.1 hypothetical protein FPSE_11022 [Fusarium pseudograminearum CS3096]
MGSRKEYYSINTINAQFIISYNTDHLSIATDQQPTMGHFDVLSKLAFHLKSVLIKSQSMVDGDLDQELYLSVPTRNLKDAGLSQHLILRDGRFLRMKCVTDVTAPDERQAKCERTGCDEIWDPELWRQLESNWGIHWKCEELHQSHQQKDGSRWSPFLAMMLTCRELYIEARASIYSSVTFCTRDLDTIHSLAVSCPNPIFNNIQHLQVTVRLRLPGFDGPNYAKKSVMLPWHRCCKALERAENLESVYLWLDAKPRSRLYMYKASEKNIRCYDFGRKLAAKLTVNAPFNPNRPEGWDTVAQLKPRFTIHARGWAEYRASHDASIGVVGNLEGSS